MTPEREDTVLDVEPGKRLGPFRIGAPENELPEGHDIRRRPATSTSSGYLLVRDLATRLGFETSPEPGLDEAEVGEATGIRARFGSVELLGRPVDDVLLELEQVTDNVPREHPDDVGSYRGRGWGLWAPDGEVLSVNVARPELTGDPTEQRDD